ncbi:hybrid sensor histidine kinase/response regulator transcription factor [Cyclobacterium salsum]|uniref:hybrid sensor histidine kinase/response regulator transcription factor n=1 Tax=Cyclobacterium salsum TaxID=2666329 RepID=UPI001391C9F8|nr:two-component regulator propeller domain-containing protein [Cyclobacterium salsum]
MKLFYLLLLLVLHWDITGLKAQSELSFEHLSEQDGLSHNRVLSIHQDKEGFIWFGTWEGLNRFDGYTFTVFQPDPDNALETLSHNVISDIAEDKDGHLWLATRGGGLNHIDKITGKVTTYLLDSIGDIYWNALGDIYDDSKGDFWISGAGGLARFELESRTLTCYPSPEEATMIVSVAEDPMGRLWAASTGKLYHFDRSNGKFIPVSLDSFSAVQFTALHVDKEGILWVGTNGDGLFRLNTRNPSPQLNSYNPGGQINKIINGTNGKLYEDNSGIIWLTTTNGLQRIDKKTDQVLTFRSDPLFPGSLSNNTVQAVLMDNNGHLWVGTTNGINKLTVNTKDYRSFQIKPTPQLFHLDENNITHLVEDENGIIWLGNSGKTKDSKIPGGGLFQFDPKVNDIKKINLPFADSSGISKNQFFIPYLDHSGNMWIGTDQALLCLDKGTGKFIQYPTAVRIQAIAEDKSGKLWFGGSKGGYIFQGALVSFDPDIKKFTYYWFDPEDKTGFNYHNVSAITVSQSGDIWVATPGRGINRLNPKSGKFTYYRPRHPYDPGSITDKDIRAIYEDSRGIIWVGTNQGGLNRFDDETEKFISYTVNQGLPSNHIESIVEDHWGNLWIGTSKGLSQLDPHTMTFQNYGTMDGLPGNMFNQGSKSRKNGKLFFGTTNGFVVFHPDSIKDNSNIPPVYITGLSVLEKPIPLPEDGKLEFSHNENFISFNYVALDYTAPEKNQYAYQLEGVDRNWVHAGTNRSANYTDLKPGNYTFRVKASNNDGLWNEEGASASISILPPWWQTWWAYTGYGLLFLMGLLMAQRETVRRERIKAGMHLQQVEAEKLREMDTLKSRFFSNISHEFRTPLSLILGTVEVFSHQEKQPTDRLLGYRLIQRSADRLLQLVNQLLDLSRLEAGKLRLQLQPGDIVGFLSLLSSSFSSFFANKGIRYKYQLPQDSLWVLFDTDKVEKMVSNLLTNACKFTPAGGEVMLEVKADRPDSAQGSLNISVHDTGVGIPKEMVSRVFERFFQADLSLTRAYEGTGIGLALTKELVELHGGTIRVDSIPGEGSHFLITLPLQIIEKPESNLQKELLIKQQHLLGNKANFISETPVPNKIEKKAKKYQTIVLVIEDNADLCHFIKNSLPAEFAVFEAEDGNIGWKKALELGPDLIISDVMMPGLDGISLCDRLKKDERTSHIAVILLTAKADMESKLAGLETGADEYLTKPFSMKELQVRVQNQIAYRQRLRERFSRSVTLQPKEMAVNSVDERFLQKVMGILEAHFSDPMFDLVFFSQELGLSRVHLHRKLKSLAGQSPGDLIRTYRLKKAVHLLEQQAGNISEVAYAVGFNSLTYFAKCFKSFYGQTPTEFISDLRKGKVKQN